jgi:DNA-3-methyladenine glycosylase I
VSTIIGPDGKPRCSWCAAAPEFLDYHGTEWGVPVSDDTRLFEKLCLEGFQSGLSWRTILAKRENFRAAFAGFDATRVASFGQRDVRRLLADEGIVRHRGKIEAAIDNAKRAVELVETVVSLAAFVWRYEPSAQERAAPQRVSESTASLALSKELKRREIGIRNGEPDRQQVRQRRSLPADSTRASRTILFCLSVCYGVFWGAVGYRRIGQNHSHSTVQTISK